MGNRVDCLEYCKLRNRRGPRLRKWRQGAYRGLHNRVPVLDDVGLTQRPKHEQRHRAGVSFPQVYFSHLFYLCLSKGFASECSGGNQMPKLQGWQKKNWRWRVCLVSLVIWVRSEERRVGK